MRFAYELRQAQHERELVLDWRYTQHPLSLSLSKAQATGNPA